MKTAISIPDELFKKAEKLAKKKKVSRSQLYAEALREYVARSPGEWVTEQINRALEGVDQTPDRFIQETARRTLRKSQW